jgi:hypothetical protein
MGGSGLACTFESTRSRYGVHSHQSHERSYPLICRCWSCSYGSLCVSRYDPGHDIAYVESLDFQRRPLKRERDLDIAVVGWMMSPRLWLMDGHRTAKAESGNYSSFTSSGKHLCAGRSFAY